MIVTYLFVVDCYQFCVKKMYITDGNRFFFNSIQNLARSLAKHKDITPEKVNILLNYCPRLTNCLTISQKDQDSVIALIIFLIQSNFQQKNLIVNYLLNLLSKLENVSFVDEIKACEFDYIPVVEKFSFCLNTALCDIAYFCPDYSTKIIDAQINLIEYISNQILEYRTKSSADPQALGMLFFLFILLCFVIFICIL